LGTAQPSRAIVSQARQEALRSALDSLQDFLISLIRYGRAAPTCRDGASAIRRRMDAFQVVTPA
jgi:hypothetical protein